MSTEEVTGRATEEMAEELHRLTCEMLLDTLRAYKNKDVMDEDGKPARLSPAFLSQAIKFLKDNGIERPASTRKRADTLKEKMPDFDELERGNVVSFKK